MALGLALAFVLTSVELGYPESPLILETNIPGAVNIEDQPFYPDLVKVSRKWNNIIIGQVEGDSPRLTLLNFYSAMSLVGHQTEILEAKLSVEPGIFPSSKLKDQIDDVDLLFDLAIQSLDLTRFPESIRKDMSQESAIQLKHVLDFVFTHSAEPINIPGYDEMLVRDKKGSGLVNSWRIPGTAITLSQGVEDDPGDTNYHFSADSVKAIENMYGEISGQPVVDQPFATPGFYENYVSSPGYLVPPKWYSRLHGHLKSVIEFQVGSQTLFQIAAAFLMIYCYVRLVVWLLGRLMSTYRSQADRDPSSKHENLGNAEAVWKRVILIVPVLATTRLVDEVLDDVINFTGVPLIVASFVFEVIFYVSLSVFAYYLFEALGRGAADFVSRLRGGQSSLQLQRLSNLVIPLCRAAGVFVGVILIYRLFLVLGFPSKTVLAFSAVPGLAIGLGASKLLSNLFAGLSLQTDRPLRVGEFCKIGDNLGFVEKIGLRSLELRTLESTIKIPNSVADEATIVNFSRHDRYSAEYPRLGVELSCPLPYQFSPFQLNELLRHCRSLLVETQGEYKFSLDDSVSVLARARLGPNC